MMTPSLMVRAPLGTRAGHAALVTPRASWLQPELDDFGRLLAWCGLDAGQVHAQPLVVASGQQIRLSYQGAEPSHVAPVVVRTSDIDQFKTWIGMPDDPFTRGEFDVHPDEFPARQWLRGADFDPGALTPQERADLELAARTYLFGYSALAADYRDAIVRMYAPFEMGVFAFHQLVIEPDAELLLPAGAPVLLLADEVTIHRGGRLLSHTPFTLAARLLRKVDR